MSLLSEETDVFAAAPGQRCAVLFLARWRTPRPGDLARIAPALYGEFDALRAAGWRLSLDRVLAGEEPPDPDQVPDADTDAPTVYATGFSHDVDLVGLFEAPTPTAALAGTLRLEQAGWERLFRTEWLIGPREFLPVVGPASRRAEDDWGFFALWKWNSAWQAASAEERRAYDLECDAAFSADVRDGAAIAGRYRLDGASQWDHIGAWRVPGPSMVDAAMHEHGRVADFKFTTSRHYLGRRTPFEDVLRAGERQDSPKEGTAHTP
ncbi:hypothetical protein [Streptomyces iconiensis]|uniref:Uncharacterized protein n=1 Tax=Streptomyces iconiensis TaxID=1384038 RepID=A0ABT6ZQY8_9ACTN|nr:hypothetical protein [Streptomyces iconiensis]MDJ1131480.1 hypothetical protein [Streptomyces iconiensis]